MIHLLLCVNLLELDADMASFGDFTWNTSSYIHKTNILKLPLQLFSEVHVWKGLQP